MRKKTEAKRQEILTVAKALFQEVGFDKASMAQIAARLGGSKATLYNYFDSKEAVFIEAVKDFSATTQGQVSADPACPPPLITEDKRAQVDAMYSVLGDSDGDIADGLRRFCEHLMELVCSQEVIGIQRMMIAEAVRSGVGKTFYEMGPKKGVDRLAGYIAEAMAKGKLRRCDAMMAAQHLIGLVKWRVLDPVLHGASDLPTKEELKAVVDSGVDVFMRAYRPEV